MLKRLRALMGRPAGESAAARPVVPDAGAVARLLASEDGDALRGAAHALAAAGQIDVAQGCLERAAALAPEDAVILTDLADVLGARGDAAGAARRYGEALAARDDFVPALLGLGRLRLAQDDARGASQLLERAAALEPRNALAQRLAGFAARAAGDLATAAQRLAASIALELDAATARALADVLDGLGRGTEADRVLEALARERPDDAAVRELLGARALARADAAAAIAWFEAAIDAAPSPSAGLHSNLGLACLRAGRLDDAIDALETAIHLEPAFVPAHVNLGLAFAEARQWPDSEAAFARALALAPDDPRALAGLGRALHKEYRLEEALAAFEKAAAAAPGWLDTHVRMGFVLRDLGRYADAAAAFAAASAAAGGDASVRALATVGRGLIALDYLRVEEALARFDEALATGAGVDAEARWNITCARLLAGDWAHAWEFYGLRWQAEVLRRPFAWPEWGGEDLAGRTLLVYAEQGLGDEIMFASCYPELASRGARLVIDCAPKLEKLFRRSFPEATVLGSLQSEPPEWLRAPPAIDLQAAAGTVASLLRRSDASFPRHTGYLKADPERVAHWRTRLTALGSGPKIGISWRGGTPRSRTRLRSMRLADWAPILGLPGAHFVSLQYHADAGEEVAAANRDCAFAVHHWQDALDDYDETAALVTALDAVVSVCTAVIHLGGALGRPVEVLVPASPEWRYGIRGDRMPWYPSVRLHRQAAPGDWGDVLAAVAAELVRKFGLRAAPALRG
ncbi:MAG: tetratricopeptide repeat protein [Burkholderiales bacterium]|nr:tetratricopeptide repeat protein [Burkholderiales bacterium]